MNKENLFEKDNIYTILNALDVYASQTLPFEPDSVVPEQYDKEFARVIKLKEFLNKVLDYKDN